MLGVLGVLVAIVFWRFLVIFGTTVFETVGLSRTAAGFESRSAIVGAGYTTARSERVIDDPASRRVAAMLVVVGYFGPTVVVGLLGITFVTPTNVDPVNRWVVLLVLLVVLYVLDRLGVFRALATAPARALSRRATARSSFEKWIVVGDHAVASLVLPRDPERAKRILGVVAQDGIDVLAIERGRQSPAMIPSTGSGIEAEPGDQMVLFGDLELLSTLRSI
ncbi:MAG: hypothetical protein QNM02_18460 [Acidimicrobiia bacterium]|nr:hypothetical protein [Acidimicrobiia bacterium]